MHKDKCQKRPVEKKRDLVYEQMHKGLTET